MGVHVAEQIATLFVGIVPTVRGIQRDLTKQLVPEANKAAGAAGVAAGKTFAGTLGKSARDVGGSFQSLGKDLQRAIAPGVDAARRFSDGFRDSQAAASSFTGQLGTLGGAAAKTVSQAKDLGRNFAAGFKDSQAAASALTGIMGTLGGSVRKVLDPVGRLGVAGVNLGRNFVAGFRDSQAAASALTGIMGTLGGSVRTVLDPVARLGVAGINMGRNFVAGFRDSQAAASSFTGVAGTIGGIFRSAVSPVENLGRVGFRMGQNFVAGFQDSQAAASSFTGVFGTIGGGVRQVTDVLGTMTGAAGRALSSAGGAASSAVSVMGSAVRTASGFVGSALSSVGDVASGVVGAFQNFGASVMDALRPIAQQIGITSDGLANLGQKVAIAGTATIGLVAGLAAKGGIKRALDIEDARAQLGGLGHDAGVVDQVMDNALASVKGTAFGLGDAATVAANAVSAGIEPGEDLQRTLNTVANSAAAAKLPLGDMGDIFSKVMATGKAYTGDIQALASRGVPMWQKLAEQLNVTEDEAAKMARTGKVSFEDFQAAAEAASGNVAKAMGETTRGKIDNFRAALSRVGEKVVKAVLPTFTDLLVKGTELADKVGGYLAPALETAAKFLSEHADIVGPLAIGIGVAVGAVSAIAAATWVWAAATSAVSLPILAVAAVIGLLIGGLIIAYQKIGWFHDFVDWVWNGIKTVVSATVTWIVGTAVPWISAALTTMGHFFSAAADVVSTAWGWIQARISQVAGWLTGTLVPWIQGALGAVSGFFRGVGETGAGIWAGIQGAASAVVTWFSTTLAPMVQTALGAVGTAMAWLRDTIVIPVWNGIKFVIVAAAAVVMTILDGVMWFIRGPLATVFTWLRDSIITPVWNGIKNTVSAAWAWIRDTVLQPTINFVRGVFSAAWTWLRDSVILPVWNGIKSVVMSSWNWIRNTVLQPAINFVRGPVSSGWTWLRNLVTQTWNNIKSTISSSWNWVRNSVLQPAINFIRGALTAAWNWLRSLVSQTWNSIKSAISTSWNWIRNSILQPAINFLRGALTSAWRWVQTTITNVWNNAKSVISNAWGTIRDRVLSPMITFVRNNVVSAYNAAKDGIKTAWDKIKSIVDKPVDFVINTVINDGFIKNFNKIAGKFPGVDKLEEVKYKGLASGGRVPGYQRRKVDDHLYPVRGGGVQPLRGGEGITVPEGMRAMDSVYGPGFHDGLNAAANAGGVGAARRWLSDRGRPSVETYPKPSKDVQYVGGPLGGPGSQMWGSNQAQASQRGFFKVPDLSFRGVAMSEVAKAWTGLSALDIRVGGSGPGVTSVSNGGNGPWGYAYSDGRIFINPSGPQSIPDIRGTLVHEMGHVLGLDHPAGGYGATGTVMSAGMNGGRWTTALDAAKLASIYGKPGENVKTYPDPGGGGGGLPKIVQWMLDLIGFDKLIEKIPGGGLPKDLMVGAAKKAWDGFQSWVGELFGGSGDDSEVASTQSAEKWRDLVIKALKHTGFPTTKPYQDAWIRQIQTESGGNPNAVQGDIGDVNNASGDLAKGLVQVIGTTFESNRDPSLPNNRFDPFANLVAGMNWVKRSRGLNGVLGWIGQGHGYAEGGRLPARPVGLEPPKLFDGGGWLDETTRPMLVEHKSRRPDAVLTNSQFSDFHALAEQVQSEGGGMENHFHFGGTPEDPDRIGNRSAEALAFRLRKVGVRA